MRALLFLVLIFGFYACENELADVNVLASKEVILPIEVSKRVELIYSDSAIVKAKLRAPILKLVKVENPFYEMPEGLYVEFYKGGIGKIESTLKADYGIKYEKTNLIEVRKNVVVVNSIGEKLETEKLTWNEKSGKIYTDQFVKITRKDEVLFGEGLEANQQFNRYKILKLKGTINLKEPIK